MQRIITIAMPFALAMAASVSVPSVLAQGMPGKTDAGRTTGPAYEVSPEVRRYRAMAGLMRDMSEQMNRMQEGMVGGGMSPEKQMRMQQQLKEMSGLMRRMAGLADRPAMSEPETMKQTGEMRKQMKSMMQAQP